MEVENLVERANQKPKYRAIIQYVGTRYHGWQVQRNRITVQATLIEVLSHLAGQKVSVVGASRTDSGVHAHGQVAHFFFPHKPSIPDLLKAVNALLPWDIRFVKLETVDPSFHAQKDAIKKRYLYRIINGPVLSPFENKRALHIRHPLDLKAMAGAVNLLKGTQDFTGFAAASTSVKNKVRTITLSELDSRENTLIYRIEGNGFLHHMVRNIVGTLIEIGLGKRHQDSISEILRERDRRLAGPTASAEGLYLSRIWYPPAPGDWVESGSLAISKNQPGG